MGVGRVRVVVEVAVTVKETQPLGWEDVKRLNNL